MKLQPAEAVARAIGMAHLQAASVKHVQIHSAYEGAAILKEKYDILWEEVTRLDAERMRAAAVKLAATALRFVVDACPPPKTIDNGKWTHSRKALNQRREKEIAAFERWQMRGRRDPGRESQEPGREDHKRRDGHRGQVIVVRGARPKNPRCRSR
ncbi:MAG TPA: hypothetical protein VG860_21170 [Terriglobia bacterium]|jgi:uncharacterized small protein (DUF1192 family)|nr:hypothetical protein [Terriglobia bacterium]